MSEKAVPPANDNSADPKVKAKDSSASKACPICSKPVLERFKPFCSKRCADIDLHRWLSGSYAIPVVEEEPLSDET